MADRIVVLASLGYLIRRADGWHYIQPAPASEPFTAEVDLALGVDVLTETDVQRVFGERARLETDAIVIGGTA